MRERITRIREARREREKVQVQRAQAFQALLPRLVRAQQHVPKSDVFIDPTFRNDFRIYLGHFVHTRQFRDLQTELLQYDWLPLDGEQRRDIRKGFAGAVFEQAAYSMIAARLLEGDVALSGDQTLQLMRELYPRHTLLPGIFGQTSIDGVSVPDSFGVHNGEISSVYEMTLSKDLRYFYDKHAAFELRKEHYPQLFGNATLTFVVPSTYILLPVMYAVNQFTNHTFEKLDGVNHGEFGAFISSFYAARVYDDGVTHADVAGWIYTQPPIGDQARWDARYAGMERFVVGSTNPPKGK